MEDDLKKRKIDLKKMEDDLKKMKKNGRQPKNMKLKMKQSTKINLIG
jgi:hypothetical protein